MQTKFEQERTEACELFQSSLLPLRPTEIHGKEQMTAAILSHPDPMQAAHAFIQLSHYLAASLQSPDSLDRKKINSWINAATQHAEPLALIEAILIIKKCLPLLDERLPPQIASALKKHDNPYVLAKAIEYFCHMKLLTNESPHANTNFVQLLSVAMLWFEEPTLAKCFNNTTSKHFPQALFDKLIMKSHEQAAPSMIRFNIACELALENQTEPSDFIAQLNEIQTNAPQINAHSRILLPQALKNTPCVSSFIRGITTLSATGLFATESPQDQKNFTQFLSLTSLWFGEAALATQLENIPHESFTQTLFDSLIAASRENITPSRKRFELTMIINDSPTTAPSITQQIIASSNLWTKPIPHTIPQDKRRSYSEGACDVTSTPT